MPSLPRPSRPLKRRARTAAPDSVLQSIEEMDTTSVEPPLKKFKALFEESDPDRLVSSLPSGNLNIMQESHQPSLILTDDPSGQEGYPRVIGGEMSQHPTAVENRGTKRWVATEDAEDNPLSTTPTGQEDSVRPPKRRVSEGLPRSITVATSQANEETRLGEPDTDTHFLTALTSMKKGKKNEDSFDREFNNLRISKPDIEREVTEQEWDLLDGLELVR